MTEESSHIVGTRDLALYLKVSRNTILKLIRERKIPVWFEAGAWRSTQERLDRWAEQSIESYLQGH